MEKSVSELTMDIMKDYDFLIIPKRDKELRLLYDTYKTSSDTSNLLSEQNRTIFADHLLLEEPKIGVRKLYWMTIEIVAKNFNGNAKEIDDNFNDVTKKNIWELVDINLPISKTIEINSELYWQRVFDGKSRNRLQIGQEKTIGLNLSIKCFGMSERIKEIFEEQSYEGWIDENMVKLVTPVAQFIFHLRFTQLLPIKEYSYDRDPNLIDYRMINYNEDECHHINLEIVGELYQLVYLSFEFSPPEMGMKYMSRYFDFSTLDMIHLANGLARLENLTTFKIRNSRMNNKKLDILVDALKSCPLESIDFSYCQLDDECGTALGKLFENNKTLQELILSGNYLSTPAISAISYAIQQFEGHLKFLNLSRNPINDNGLLFLARAIYKKNQIEILNLCGIQISVKGCAVLPNILEHQCLKSINLTALPIGEILGEEIINSIDINTNLLKCHADECDLSLEQELKIRILIKRNNYINENPYIGTTDISVAKENLPDTMVSQTRNKIYLRALELLNRHQDCQDVLNQYYKIQLPDINKFIKRHSVQVTKLMTAEMTLPQTDKIGKKKVSYNTSDIYKHKEAEPDPDPEVEYVKNSSLSKTGDRHYFTGKYIRKRNHDKHDSMSI